MGRHGASDGERPPDPDEAPPAGRRRAPEPEPPAAAEPWPDDDELTTLGRRTRAERRRDGLLPRGEDPHVRPRSRPVRCRPAPGGRPPAQAGPRTYVTGPGRSARPPRRPGARPATTPADAPAPATRPAGRPRAGRTAPAVRPWSRGAPPTRGPGAPRRPGDPRPAGPPPPTRGLPTPVPPPPRGRAGPGRRPRSTRCRTADRQLPAPRDRQPARRGRPPSARRRRPRRRRRRPGAAPPGRRRAPDRPGRRTADRPEAVPERGDRRRAHRGRARARPRCRAVPAGRRARRARRARPAARAADRTRHRRDRRRRRPGRQPRRAAGRRRGPPARGTPAGHHRASRRCPDEDRRRAPARLVIGLVVLRRRGAGAAGRLVVPGPGHPGVGQQPHRRTATGRRGRPPPPAPDHHRRRSTTPPPAPTGPVFAPVTVLNATDDQRAGRRASARSWPTAAGRSGRSGSYDAERRRRHHRLLHRGRRDPAAGGEPAARPSSRSIAGRPSERFFEVAERARPRHRGDRRRQLAALTPGRRPRRVHRSSPRNTDRPPSVRRSVRPSRGLVRPRPRPGARATLAALAPPCSPPPCSPCPGRPRPAGRPPTTSRTEDATVPSGTGADAVELDTTLYLPGLGRRRRPAPAVVLAHGFGGSKDSVADDARDLAGRGYVVLTYSARGFGAQHRADRPGRPALRGRRPVHAARPARRAGRRRSSTATATRGSASPGPPTAARWRCSVPPTTTGSTPSPRRSPGTPSPRRCSPPRPGRSTPATRRPPRRRTGDTGVYKRLWSGLFFGVGSVPTGDGLLASLDRRCRRPRRRPALPDVDPSTLDSAAVEQALTCGRFRADVCAAYQAAAATGTLTPEIAAVLDRASPAGVLDRITAPTLLVQGTQDSLFGLGQADANARGIAANGTPVKVVWYAGGHDASASDAGHRRPARPGRRLVRRPPARRTGDDPGTGFELPRARPVSARPSARVQGGSQTEHRRGLPRVWTAPSRPSRTDVAADAAPPQPVVTPAGGNPAAITTVPGLGALTAALGGTTVEIPGQFAAFDSAAAGPTPSTWSVPPTVDARRLLADRHGHAVRQALRRRRRRRRRRCPSGLVAPLALTGLSTDPTAPTEVEVTLPGIVHRFEAGHTMRVRGLLDRPGLRRSRPSRRSTPSALADGAALAVPDRRRHRAAPRPARPAGGCCSAVLVAPRRCSAGRRRDAVGRRAAAGSCRSSSPTARTCRCASRA